MRLQSQGLDAQLLAMPGSRALGLALAAIVSVAGIAACAAGRGQSSTMPASPPGPHQDGGAKARPDGGALLDAAVDAGNDDPDPELTSDMRDALAGLALNEIPPPPPDVTNRWADDARAAHLGQALFFEPMFSGKLLDGDNDGSANALGHKGDTGKVACSGCHLPQSGFVDTRTVNQQISLGSGWVLRRTPSLLDVSRSRLITWVGRRDALYNQPFGPIESPVEMNSSRLFVAQQLFAHYRSEYEAIFGAMPPLDDASRFPPLTADTTGCSQLDADNHCKGTMHGTPGDGAELDGLSAADQDAVTRVVVNLGKALAAYERHLSCGTSRFDRFMGGDPSALSRAEQRGAGLFVTKAKCVDCHGGPFLSDEKFHNVGLRPSVVATVFLDANDEGLAAGLKDLIRDPLNTHGIYSDGDDGRTPAEVPPGSDGAFRSPRLRCVSGRPSFMHTGQLQSLGDVVAFFVRGGDGVGFPGTSEIKPLDLTLRERADLVAFMRALDGPGPSSDLLRPP
jgi:cytochrome c peroxidase